MKILIIFGTRPEAIKMASVIYKLKQSKKHQIKVCNTGQHCEMLDQVLDIFNICPDYDLNIMQKNQNLTKLTILLLQHLDKIYLKNNFDLVLVQGDTTTTLIGALLAFYYKIPVGHIEAGLRSFNKLAPWPEEMNRILTSDIAAMHFAPTQTSAQNLLKENIHSGKIYITGNTIVDSLIHVKKFLKNNKNVLESYKKKYVFINFKKKVILVTGHRRESFGQGFKEICMALSMLAKRKDVEIIYPVHMNPNILRPANKYLGKLKNIFLIKPQDYLGMIYLMQNSYLILTDSGGIQEEAPSFGKPLIVMRETTERTEGIKAGIAILAGLDAKKIFTETSRLLDDVNLYNKMKPKSNPYGDGKASARIVRVLEDVLQHY